MGDKNDRKKKHMAGVMCGRLSSDSRKDTRVPMPPVRENSQKKLFWTGNSTIPPVLCRECKGENIEYEPAIITKLDK